MDQILKSDLLIQLQKHFEDELASLRRSADAAAEAATHPENKPENKYDTRGLEASYLAGAQRARALELVAAIKTLQTMALQTFGEDDAIAATALVEVHDGTQATLYFLMTIGAGYQLTLSDKTVMTVSTQSPIGQALLGKYSGDAITVRTAQGKKDYEILAIY